MLKRFFAFTLAGLLILLTGCSPNVKSNGKTEPLRVAAAADLSQAFKEIGAQFQKETGVPVEFNFGSTGTLAMQIENGAPFDVFAAANVAVVDGLKGKGLILPDTQQLYAQGRIGIATLVKGKVTAKDLDTLATSQDIKKIAIANPEHAPYGTAAQEAFQYKGFWEKVKDKLVYGKNIQDTLVLLQSGDVDVAIIAVSIAKPEEVNFTLINSSWHKPLNQSMAVIKSTKQEGNARQFLTYVNGSEGRKVMRKYGFILPGEEAWSK